MQKGKLLWSLVLFMLLYGTAHAQVAASDKGTFYVSMGNNASFYSKSDIRLVSHGAPSFDFTLHNVGAKDDGISNFNTGSPQYSFQLGYYSHKKNWGVEFTFDHNKYYVTQNQRVRLTGRINNTAYNTDTVLTPDFVKLEHSDGANYAIFKLVRWQPLITHENNTLLNLTLKAGAGPVIPKTNSTIMGNYRDDRYKIAGYVIALEGGLRYNIARHLFAEGNAKGAFANYSHFLIANGRGSQQWYGLHIEILLGFQI
jgi:hypothetical protein